MPDPAIRCTFFVTETEVELTVAARDLHAALPCVVAAVRDFNFAMKELLLGILRLFRFLRNDVDDAGDSMTTVERRTGAAHDLDALDVTERDGIPIDAAVKGRVELLSIVHDKDVRTAKSTQLQAILHFCRRRNIDACLPRKRFAQTEDMPLFKFFRRDDGDVGGNFVDRFRDSRRRDGRLSEVMSPRRGRSFRGHRRRINCCVRRLSTFFRRIHLGCSRNGTDDGKRQAFLFPWIHFAELPFLI